jgi:hypothetical protein
MYWKPEYGDFISVWKKDVNQWVETDKFTKIIFDEYKNRDDLLFARKVEKQMKKVEEEEFEDEDFNAKENIDNQDSFPTKTILNSLDSQEMPIIHTTDSNIIIEKEEKKHESRIYKQPKLASFD